MRNTWFCVALLSLFLALGCEIPPGKNALIEKWAKNRAQYQQVVDRCRSAKVANGIGLSTSEYDLSIDHNAWIDRETGFRVSFVLARWGIDNSYGIVYQDPEGKLPESDEVFEKWATIKRLDRNWYFVEGT